MDKAHKVIGIVGLVVVAICTALSQDASMADPIRHYAGLALGVLGLLGFGVTKPVFARAAVAAATEEKKQ